MNKHHFTWKQLRRKHGLVSFSGTVLEFSEFIDNIDRMEKEIRIPPLEILNDHSY